MNYYNDFETGDWLRQLVKNNLIPKGYVDDRSITDIKPRDLDGYEQCHFFAGIAGWPRALDIAGWNAATPIWSASLPCQPFSCAGQQKGHEDDRHLWPIFFGLVEKCRPPVIVGEQVASKDGREWLAGIQTDLETLGYSTAAADLPAASVGSPHKRNRLFWCAVGDSNGNRCNGQSVRLHKQPGNGKARQESLEITGASPTGRVADSERNGGRADKPRGKSQRRTANRRHNFWSNSIAIPCADGKWRRVPGRVADSKSRGLERGWTEPESLPASTAGTITGNQGYEGEGKQHQLEIEPALFPLADGIPGRVGLLKGAGNAIVGPVAAVFIESVMEIIEPELNRHQGA